ncbi:MAG: hypothetical protein H0W63_10595 [Gemmatimonadaceae bacterium]|nr:hypothetical protein [Gemmatimonadaceae bacterium]
MKAKRTEPATKRRFSPAVVLSIGVHIVVAVVLMRLLVIPKIDLFGHKAGSAQVQRIGFIRLSNDHGIPTAGRDGGDGRAYTKTHSMKLVAPTSVPTSVPPAVAQRQPVEEGGSGPLVGNGGPARGIKPVFSDPRLWGPPGKIVSAPRTLKQDLDSLIAFSVGRYTDSLASEPPLSHWVQGDWTIGSGKHKIGWDPGAIRLGPVSIPNALLALLPLNVTMNPTVYARNKEFNYMHRDISEHAQQAIDEADFNKAVRSIRVRKDRERAAALQGSVADSSKNR